MQQALCKVYVDQYSQWNADTATTFLYVLLYVCEGPATPKHCLAFCEEGFRSSPLPVNLQPQHHEPKQICDLGDRSLTVWRQKADYLIWGVGGRKIPPRKAKGCADGSPSTKTMLLLFLSIKGTSTHNCSDTFNLVVRDSVKLTNATPWQHMQELATVIPHDISIELCGYTLDSFSRTAVASANSWNEIDQN